MKPLRRHHRAIALIVTLVSLVIATILIVAFVTTMRTERRAANAVANDERSKLIAQTAVQHAMALLNKNIPQPVPLGYVSGVTSGSTTATATGTPPVNWMINPGLLTLYTGAAGSTPRYVPLSTDTNSASPATVPTGDVVNLNARLLTTNGYPIIPTGDALPMNWVYVSQDPTAVASATNPIIGRYAFWMDDENNKININTAYGKPPGILNPITGDTNNLNYMVRSNPLDQTVDNGQPWMSGSSTFEPEVGFDSLSESGTDISPGASPYTSSTNNAIAVGNPPQPGRVPGYRYYPIWHPSSVNLDLLPASLTSTAAIGVTDSFGISGALNRENLADWVYNGVYASSPITAQWRLLQTPSQIQQFISGTAAAAAFYQANQFNLTAYNRAPEFNVFGKPRLLMEQRIASMEASTTNNATDSCFGRLSGTELEFCQTPDLDPFGATYFHGLENKTLNSGGGHFYSDMTSVQMVGDYLSSMLARTDWPGMPANQSFVSKWGNGGGLEADQVAWNIVSMGNYASNMDYCYGNTASWPDDQVVTVKQTLGLSGSDSASDISPYHNLLTSQPSNLAGSTQVDPNLCLRLGKLSGKAIMPFSPKPYLDDILLQVTAVPVAMTGTTAAIKASTAYYLNLSLQVQAYIPRRGPPGTIWTKNNGYGFVLTHFFYRYSGTDNTGAQVSGSQGATGYPCSGDGGVSDGYGGVFKNTNYDKSGGAQNPWAQPLQGQFSDPGVSEIWEPADSYLTWTTAISSTAASGDDIYVSSSPSMLYDPAQTSTNTVIIPAGAQQFTGTVTLQAKMRLALYSHDVSTTYEIIPVWDNVNTNVPALAPPALPNASGTQTDSIAWSNVQINLSGIPTANKTVFYQALQVTDPRLGGNALDQNGNPTWIQYPATPVNQYTGLINGPNSAPGTTNVDLDSYGYFDFQGIGGGGGFYKNSPRPSIGFLDCVPTGMQRGIVNSTLNFGPSGNTAQLPDWLILDLVAPTFADTTQPTFAPYSYLHSTMGKININSTIYPNITGTSGNTTQRPLPLEALFKNTVPDSLLPTIVNNIATTATAGSLKFGAPNQYGYVGELCEVPGVADGTIVPTLGSGAPQASGTTGTTKWQREALIRDLANLITTQSNTFHLWGAAQAVKVVKGSGNTNYGIYQTGDTVTVLGEKRFESVIERSVWPGVDGVPGNGHVSATGTYDQNSSDTNAPMPASLPWAAVALSGAPTSVAIDSPGTSVAQWAQFDGPDNPNAPRALSSGAAALNYNYTPSPGWYGTSSQPVPWTSTSLQNARNPARVVMSYKPLLFRYISE
jgi:hypothetical protein